jgi:hypothetical protein
LFKVGLLIVLIWVLFYVKLRLELVWIFLQAHRRVSAVSDIVIVVFVDLDLTKRVSSMIFKCNSSFGLCVTDHESLIVRARDTWVMRKISATEIIGAVNFVFTSKIWKEIASTL